MSHLAEKVKEALQHIEPIGAGLVIDARYLLNLVHHHITARIRFIRTGTCRPSQS
jgi:hypothetical protein